MFFNTKIIGIDIERFANRLAVQNERILDENV